MSRYPGHRRSYFVHRVHAGSKVTLHLAINWFGLQRHDIKGLYTPWCVTCDKVRIHDWDDLCRPLSGLFTILISKPLFGQYFAGMGSGTNIVSSICWIGTSLLRNKMTSSGVATESTITMLSSPKVTTENSEHLSQSSIKIGKSQLLVC